MLASISWRDLLATPWVDYRPNGSSTLLITFSPMGTPEGRFAPYTAVNGLSYSILRFNGPNAQWYVGGIPETDAFRGGLEKLVDNLIEEEGYSRVIVFGGSKGGFGALDIGLRIRSDVIISTGAETLFGMEGGNARGPVSNARISRGRARLRHWRSLRSTSGQRVFCIYGGASHIDILCACRAGKIFGMAPIVLGNCGHSVPLFMIENEYNIADMIVNLADTGADDFLTRHRSSVDVRKYEGETMRVEAGLQAEFDSRSRG